jgi:hypothetical protein
LSNGSRVRQFVNPEPSKTSHLQLIEKSVWFVLLTRAVLLVNEFQFALLLAIQLDSSASLHLMIALL